MEQSQVAAIALTAPPARRTILKPALGVLIAALVGLAYVYADSRIIGAYGDRPEELAYLKGVDPKALTGGDLTHFKFGTISFSEPAANLPWQLEIAFDAGDGHFERPFRPASASSQGSDGDGLGPLYNNVSCEACHTRDGRAEPVPGGSLLLRLSVPGKGDHGGPKPHPVYGGQLADRAIPGMTPEGSIEISWSEIHETHADGTPYVLRRPHYTVGNPGYGPLGDDLMISPRGAPAMFGVGLLEAIPDATLRGWADPEDRDGDGISGRPNVVWDSVANTMAIGRFGWKAENATVLNQATDAAVNDMGITSAVHRSENCTAHQTDCLKAIHGGDASEPELLPRHMEDMALYLQLLAVPGRGHLDDPGVIKGEGLFEAIGCAACHKPVTVTGNDHPVRRLRNQTIRPFTDLLLHDMGERLADNRPSFDANGREWRTAPLWGIALTKMVNGHTRYLHDGRAFSLEEAVLWHGGEAQAARERFRTMDAADREALLRFLKSL